MRTETALYRTLRKTLAAVSAVIVCSQAAQPQIVSFRVAFADVPGTDKIETGRMQAGIETLEAELERAAPDRSGDILATLCAAYIVDTALRRAERACNEAATEFPSKLAYNNRGVLRAVTGNLDGAREDFNRAGTGRLDAYYEELRKRDVVLVATDNLELVERYLRERNAGRVTRRAGADVAAIEEPEI